MFKFKPITETIQEANINHFVGVNTVGLKFSKDWQEKEFFLAITAHDYKSLKRGKHRFRISEMRGLWIAELNDREIADFNNHAADYNLVQSDKHGRVYEPKAHVSFKDYYNEKMAS